MVEVNGRGIEDRMLIDLCTWELQFPKRVEVLKTTRTE